MASVSVKLVEFLQEQFKDINSDVAEAYIRTIKKAGEMNNPDVEKILEKAWVLLQEDDWAAFGGTFAMLSEYPELKEDVLTANMLSLDSYDFVGDVIAQNASDKDKYIAKRLCELTLSDKTAFDNDVQRKQQEKLMQTESYRITFLYSTRELLKTNVIPENERKAIVSCLEAAEKEFNELAVS